MVIEWFTSEPYLEMAENWMMEQGELASAPIKRKQVSEYQCILLCGKTCSVNDSLDNITSDKWKSIHDKAFKWKALDTFGNVYCCVKWENGPKGHYIHNSCYTSLSSNGRLLQAEKRQQKSQQSLQKDHKSQII